jgi:hypothetical protein
LTPEREEALRRIVVEYGQLHACDNVYDWLNDIINVTLLQGNAKDESESEQED